MQQRDKKHVFKPISIGLTVLVALVLLMIQVTGFVHGQKVNAKSTSSLIGVVAVSNSTGLTLYSQPNTASKPLGTIKNKEKVTMVSTNQGWSTITYQGEKGYVPSSSIRYSSDFSSGKAKQISDHVIQVQRETWKQNYTKKQLVDILTPSFTQDYIDRYIKQLFRPAGTNANGTPLFHIIETEIHGLAIEPFDWGAQHDPQAPKVTHYRQDGKEVLIISQYHLNEERGNHLSTLYLSRANTNGSWKVTDFISA